MPICTCPGCSISLNVPEEMMNSTLQCPKCRTVFSPYNAPAPQLEKQETPETQENALRYFWKSRYFWGFLFIKYCKVLACITAVVCLLYSGWRIYSVLDAQYKRRQKILEIAQEVVEKEKDFEQQYLDSIVQIASAQKGGRLLSGSTDPDKVKISGFKLPADVVSPAIQFNLNLASIEDTQESLDAADRYRDLLKKAEVAIVKELTNYLKNLEKFIADLEMQIAKQEGRSTNSMSFQRKNKVSSVVFNIGKQKNFFVSEQSIKNSLDSTRNMLDKIKQGLDFLKRESSTESRIYLANNPSQIEWDFEILKKYFKYVNNLLTHQRMVFLNAKQGDQKAEQAKVISDTERVRDYFVERLTPLIKNLNRIADSDNWKISEQLNTLSAAIKHCKSCWQEEKDRRETELKKLCIDILTLWLQCLLCVLVIMVTADFLEAHFDNAGNSFKRIK